MYVDASYYFESINTDEFMKYPTLICDGTTTWTTQWILLQLYEH